ncbi:MAG: B12-binding domain-containing radical SAM protein [Muribaculaceae bacterium]|nr:B12-binding domain-containing radical SAM protein [Muribaculaceae bacterium]
MKVCFLIPPEPVAETPAERSAGCTRVVYPMPNLYELTVAALVESEGYDVSYVDLSAGGDLRAFVGSDNSDVYMIWSVNLSRAADFAARDAIIELRPEAKVVFLGPGATFFPKLYLTDSRVIIARGEPEMTVSELLGCLRDGGDYTGLQGLTLLGDGGRIVRNPSRRLMTDLDALPFPARHLAGKTAFHNPKLKLSPYTTMLTSRNCPFRCIYCVPSSLTFARELDFREDNGRKPPISFRSVESVEKEIDMLAAEGYRAIGFVDDNFIWNEERTAGICRALKKHGIIWGCQARADAITEPIAKILGESGCTYVDLGVESFNDEILKFIRKGETSEQIFKAIGLLQKYKVPVKLNILIGTSPLETRETLKDTLKKAKALKVDQVMFNIVSPFPGTEFYAMAKENGWIAGGEYEPTNVQRDSILSYPHLSAEEMERILFRFNLRYFLSPRIIWKHMRRFRSFSEFRLAFNALWIKLFGK